MAEASSTDDVITLRIRFKSETLDKFIEKYGVDLSPSEVFVRTRDPLEVGTPLAFEFSLHDGTPLIAGRGTVAWVRPPSPHDPAPPGMGIGFETLTPDSTEMLSQILEERGKREERNGPAWPNARFTAPIMEAVQDAPVRRRFEALPDRGGRVELPRPDLAPRPRAEAEPAPLPVSMPRGRVTPTNGPSLEAVGHAEAAEQDALGDAIATLPPGREDWSDNDEKTEIARVPPSFYYNAADEASTQTISVSDAITEDSEETTKPRAEQPLPAMAKQPLERRPQPMAAAPLRQPAGPPPSVSFDVAPTPISPPRMAPAAMPEATATASGGWSQVSSPAASVTPRLSTPMGEPIAPVQDPLADMRPQPLAQLDAGGAFDMPWAPGGESTLPARRSQSTKTAVLVVVLLAIATLAGLAFFLGPRLLTKPTAGGTETPGTPAPVAQPAPAPPAAAAPAVPATPPAVPAADPAAAAPAPAPPAAPPSAPAAAPPPAAAPAAAPAPAPAAAAPAPGGLGSGRPAEPPGSRNTRPGRRSTNDVIAAAQAREGTEAAGGPEIFWLHVRSVPDGADVIIDGRPEGKTPFQRRIYDSGRAYRIAVKKPGFEGYERTVGSGDEWVRTGNTRTITVSAALKASAEPAAEPKAAEPKATEPPPTTPPAAAPERKNNPFDDPPATGP